jgi:predicted TIM-barrel fold metal-dependent hydrolase
MQIFDAHLHIIDPRFPLVANRGFVPDPFTCEDYLGAARPLGIVGGAVVSGSFQGFDQGYLRAALECLGPRFVGVTQLPANVTDAEVLALDAVGVRAVRFNLHRGGSARVEALDSMARRIWELARWHVELYVDSRELVALAHTLARLPKLSIDHLGLSREGLPELLRLVERGAMVKATGFGRGDLDIRAALVAIAAANPAALMFGTDLPSTRAPRPFAPTDIDLLLDALGETLGRRALYENALALYRPRDTPDAARAAPPGGAG